MAEAFANFQIHNADLEWLAESSAGRSEEEISIGLRWFFYAGLGISVACMGGVASSHDHKTQRIRKRHRVAVRFAVAIVLMSSHGGGCQLSAAGCDGRLA